MKLTSVIALLLAASAFSAGSACGSEPAPKQTAERLDLAELTPAPELLSSNQGIVAMVNGKPILAHCVAEQVRATGKNRHAALDDCIGFELLAQEASKRGDLVIDEEVQQEGKEQLVASFLQARYPLKSPEDIPEDLVQSLWAKVKDRRYNHPELRDFVFCRVELGADEGPGTERYETTMKFYQRLYEEFRGRDDVVPDDLFEACYTRFENAGVKDLKLQTFRLTAEQGIMSAFRERVFSEWGQGQIAPPLFTQYGLDLILITEVVPARTTTYEEAEAEMREALFENPAYEASRNKLFVEWYEELVGKVSIERYPERVPGPNPLAAAAPGGASE